MSFDSHVRCDLETLDVTINNHERMATAPEAWSRIKKLVEEKLTSTNKSSFQFPELEECVEHVESCPGGYPLSDGQLLAIENTYKFIVGNKKR